MINLSRLIHVEMAVRDLEAAYRFLKDSLGARKVQEVMAGPG